jgi:hypothetical protein
MIGDIVQSHRPALNSGGGATIDVTLNGADIFNAAGCIPVSSIKDLPVLTLRSGQEFCERDGRLVARIGKFQNGGKFFVTQPCEFDDACSLESSCRMDWLGGKVFIYERLGDDDRGAVALLRARAK